MTDEEVNIAVARKLGDWEFVPTQGGSDSYWRRISYPEFPFLPDYCHDIKAAWEIVEHPEIVWHLIQSPSGWWNARGQKIGTGLWIEHADKKASMAICLAFLKLQ